MPRSSRVSTRPISLPDDQHGGHRADAPRPQHEARGDDRVIHEILQIGRLQRQRGVVGEADDRDEDRCRR